MQDRFARDLFGCLFAGKFVRRGEVFLWAVTATTPQTRAQKGRKKRLIRKVVRERFPGAAYT